MMNVTDNAVRQLHTLLSQRTENSPKGLRVQVAKGGCSGLHYEMALDEQKEGDAKQRGSPNTGVSSSA